MLADVPYTFVLSTVPALAIFGGWLLEARRHARRLAELPIRIHVNGIRGKSTVTRILAGLLREAGIPTCAKSTGSAARVIYPDGREAEIQRRGAASILEQLTVIHGQVPPETRALVVECMALRPSNQDICERQIVRSNIGVITNVREDHQDVMGVTLPEIARALLNTCPRHGVLLTAEQNPKILELMATAATRRGSRLIVADPADVTDEDLCGFDYVAFKDNVAIGLVLARLLGIPRAVAMRGMQRAAPDPGALRLRHIRIADRQVTWATLFAVNDRESTVISVEMLRPYQTRDTITVGLLNNRADREQRAYQFADIAARAVRFDRLATLGAYEGLVTQRLIELGYPAQQILNLGEQRDPSLNDLVMELILRMPARHVLLVGLVNIHTKQADMLLDYLEPWHTQVH